jgi:hypothetical protein
MSEDLLLFPCLLPEYVGGACGSDVLIKAPSLNRVFWNSFDI